MSLSEALARPNIEGGTGLVDGPREREPSCPLAPLQLLAIRAALCLERAVVCSRTGNGRYGSCSSDPIGKWMLTVVPKLFMEKKDAVKSLEVGTNNDDACGLLLASPPPRAPLASFYSIEYTNSYSFC